MGSFSNAHISKCLMIPEWHQHVSMSGYVEESETAIKLQLYATSVFQVHSFVVNSTNMAYGKMHPVVTP